MGRVQFLSCNVCSARRPLHPVSCESSRDLPTVCQDSHKPSLSTQVVASCTNCPGPCFFSFIFLFNYKISPIYWQMVSHNKTSLSTPPASLHLMWSHLICLPLDLDFRNKMLHVWLGPIGSSLVGFPAPPSPERSSLMHWLCIVSHFPTCPSYLRKSLLGYDVLSGFRCRRFGIRQHSQWFPCYLNKWGAIRAGLGIAQHQAIAGCFKPHRLPNSIVPFSQKSLPVAYITAKNQCLQISLQEGRNINFMNSPSVYTLVRRMKCCSDWARLFAASEEVLYENTCLDFGIICVMQ